MERPSPTQPAAAPVTVIEVAEVAPATAALPEVQYKAAVEALLAKPPSRWQEAQPGQVGLPVEACSRYHGRLVAEVYFHPVVAALAQAFDDHRPVVLSPDAIWLLIAQGFANHVNANAEELRPRLVSHQGKLTIAVRRDDFVKGSPENPWPEAFAEFSARIRGHVGPATHDLLLPTFSTTGAAERAAAEVVLLDAMKSFFAFEMHSGCGIPQVVLEGTAGDWAAVAERARGLERFGLGWWTEALAPILDRFASAARGGRPDARFWQSIYKLDGGSGGPYVNGWFNAFFPYLKHWETGCASWKNPWLAKGGAGLQRLLYPPARRDPGSFGGEGPTTEHFPAGLARAPFLWRFPGQEFEMEFLGGFVGVRQEADTLRLRPEIGWAAGSGRPEPAGLEPRLQAVFVTRAQHEDRLKAELQPPRPPASALDPLVRRAAERPARRRTPQDGLVDLLRQREVHVGDAAGGVRAQLHPHLAPGDAQIGVVPRRLAQVADQVHQHQRRRPAVGGVLAANPAVLEMPLRQPLLGQLRRHLGVGVDVRLLFLGHDNLLR
jgi:hypothetical protein